MNNMPLHKHHILSKNQNTNSENDKLYLKGIIMTILFYVLTIGAAQAQQGRLTVNVINFKNTKGACRYWLYSSADGFPTDGKKAIKIVDASITGTSSQFVFEDLPAGTYAVTVIHDENGNHKFDTNFMGFPKERYGTSNGERGGIGGPPKFKNASFTHTGTNLVVTIKVE
jgi:uncharacterized protein (DUF2141 family)